MSRIGKKPISVPANVEITVNKNEILVKGPKGTLTVLFESEYVAFSLEEGVLIVSRKDDSKPSRSRHGLYRSLVSNAIEGVVDGYSKKLEIYGVGYRGVVKGSQIEFSLGFSHPVIFAIPAGITVAFEKDAANTLVVSGIDKQLVGQVAANIREYKKPEPYKGKGIRYSDEQVVRKAGKSSARK
jgi:large subunit ribosomal protein L6